MLTGSLQISDKIYTLTAVPSVKWESSDSAAARKHMPSILESLAESQINGEKDKPRGKYIRNGGSGDGAQGKAFRKSAQVHTLSSPSSPAPGQHAPPAHNVPAPTFAVPT